MFATRFGRAEWCTRGGEVTIDTFATPTIIHFCAALMVLAILTSPWPSLAGAGLAITLTGLAGFAYSVVIVWRPRRGRLQTGA